MAQAGRGLGTVAITGAAGRIGSFLRTELRPDAEGLLLLDRVPPPPAGDGEACHTVDLLDAPALTAALAGADAIVHMGGISDEARFPDLVNANIVGTHNVLEAARKLGIGRVVLASSNRAGGFYPTSHTTDPTEPPRPDGLYGVTKAAIEALGRLYADKFGLTVVCLRIGSYEDAPTESRHLATWLSPRDAAGFVRAALTADVDYTVAYAVSANTRRFWALPDPDVLPYTPLDDAETHASEIPAPDAAFDPKAPQAGTFASPEFTLRFLDE
ncbi:NAD-dependent epimerase/dehydratase family protein [Yinghuangia seranimata]|uniref:NAD-dependent epimerase/dehydratase family protein n=1 Tax=Yinghuangia seranimata TaxID=408067 RepID=UPI00248B67E1|nr:NAD(P)-dependent oxidoreductase [Yinghuangia seranimata]MDI2132894.1 NAD(P)-dependent oxidoreductase [Yinghuangia seranimata]